MREKSFEIYYIWKLFGNDSNTFAFSSMLLLQCFHWIKNKFESVLLSFYPFFLSCVSVWATMSLYIERKFLRCMSTPAGNDFDLIAPSMFFFLLYSKQHINFHIIASTHIDMQRGLKREQGGGGIYYMV